MPELVCGCCKTQATNVYNQIAWCCAHDIYECRFCWEHGHPWATEDTWGCCEERDDDDCHKGIEYAHEDEGGSDTSRPQRPDL